jgi:hypothetical protein
MEYPKTLEMYKSELGRLISTTSPVPVLVLVMYKGERPPEEGLISLLGLADYPVST